SFSSAGAQEPTRASMSAAPTSVRNMFVLLKRESVRALQRWIPSGVPRVRAHVRPCRRPQQAAGAFLVSWVWQIILARFSSPLKGVGKRDPVPFQNNLPHPVQVRIAWQAISFYDTIEQAKVGSEPGLLSMVHAHHPCLAS